MIFVIQTNDEVSGLDITNLLNFAHIEHTILSKQGDESTQQLRAADAIYCVKCGDEILPICGDCNGEN